MTPFRWIPVLVLLVTAGAASAAAAEHPSLVKARTLYNSADYDAAIQAAADARTDPEWADAAALVAARAHLERYRRAAQASDLEEARTALLGVRHVMLTPRDQVDLQVGMGQYLFLTDAFGAAAEIFDTALAQAFLMSAQDRLLLLDWWANAVDRAAQAGPADQRARTFERLVVRMEEELRRDPGSPVANYWLVAGARGSGAIERAWHAAAAAWVRFGLWPEAAPTARDDLDRLVVQAIIPERARARADNPQDAAKTMLDEWESFKQQWRSSSASLP